MASGYKLKFEYRPNYLFVTVEGQEDSFEISLAYWSDISVECALYGVTRLLVLENIVQGSNDEDASRLIAALPGLGFDRIRVAFVDPFEDVDVMVHCEIEARNSGVAGHVFGSVDMAERWLLSDLTTERSAVYATLGGW